MPGDRILVIKLGALGDFIQALGPMAAIRRAHPDDRLTLLTTRPFSTLGRDCGYFDDIMIDNRPRWLDLRGWLALRKALNVRAFRRVYDLQNNDRTGLYHKLFSPRPEWVGVAEGASHRNASPLRNAGKAFGGHVQTLALAGIHDVTIDTLGWMRPAQDFALPPRSVLLVPGGAPQHPQKRWPAQNYAALASRLIEHEYTPVLIGGAAEAGVTKTIADGAPGTRDLTGRTELYDIAALARIAAGAIGNDTGPMHLIAPTGCKSLVLFSGASLPHRHAPLGDHVTTLQTENLSDLSVEKVWDAFAAQQTLS